MTDTFRAQGFLSAAGIDAPVVNVAPVSGGFLHRMYRVQTREEIYALKVLNAEIMTRPDAPNRFVLSEKFAVFCQARGLPVVAALGKGNQVIFEKDGTFFMLFPWIDGKTLTAKDVTVAHCRKIGQILHAVHTANFNPDKANPNVVFSHGDLDLKNVLWQNDAPSVIDCEAAGYVNPMQELLETGVSFSGFRARCFSPDLFAAVLRGYGARAAVTEKCMRDSYGGALSAAREWLAYNEKRAMCDDAAEARTGQIAAAEARLFLAYCDASGERLIETWARTFG